MIYDLLDFTRERLGAGIPLQLEPVDLRKLVAEVVEEVRGSFPGRTLQVSAEGELAGEWDEGRLAQVLSNLLINAAQHSPPQTAISLRCSGEDGEVVLSIHNGGTPISPELLPRIFQPMVQGERGSSGGGLGLGLFIVDRVVAAHHGSVAVSSTAEAGTTFTVTLPRHPSRPRASAEPAQFVHEPTSAH